MITPQRERLPDTRPAINHKFEVGGIEGYLRIGCYPDGRPGEIFIDIQQAGGAVSGLADNFCIAISMLLQSGWTIDKLSDKFIGQKFAPSGITPNPQIPEAESIVDYIFQWMKIHFAGVPKIIYEK